MLDPFHIIEPKGKPVPVVLSVPHCGIEFPEEVKSNYVPELIQAPDDTDWFVHKLYDFTTDLGVTVIHARYSRWVIDLNRDPESKPLYDDGRIITALTPTTNFLGESIYADGGFLPDQAEVARRLETYYWPYYQAVQGLLQDLKSEFGKVLLWDAHSIRRFVPTIRKENFPDLILGNNDQTTAHPKLIRTALTGLSSGLYQVNHNTPFKGGHITRYFGKPDDQVHALQLEMAKDLYMDDSEMDYHEGRASEMRSVLKPTFEGLIAVLNQL